MSYRALMLTQTDDGNVNGTVTTITDADLPQDGNVVVDVDYSNLNYKDGLIMNGLGKLVRDYPHIPGVDMAGTVVSSDDGRYQPGDKVLVTGWRFGVIWWGGCAERARACRRLGRWRQRCRVWRRPRCTATRTACATTTAGTTRSPRT